MKCLSPIVIENKKYRLLKPYNKNLTRYMLVPCNKCLNCLKNNVSQWFTRILFESLVSDTSFFVTFTYSDHYLPKDGVCKRDIQLFHKRLRKAGFKFKYYIISEYGPDTLRAHYHGIYFGLPEYVFSEFWKLGFVMVKDILPQRIQYVCSYHILKGINVPEFKNPNFRLLSNGLGYTYMILRESENIIRNDYSYLVNSDGFKVVVPRYFKKKLNAPKKYLVPDPKVIKRTKLINYNSAIKINLQSYINRKLKNKQL